MSYSTVSHVAHESYPPPQGYPGVAPPPPPRPRFEQGYASGLGPRPGPGPGYQSYFSDNYPPQVSHMHYSGPTRPFQQPYGGYHSNDNGLSSLLRAAMAALCCCCFLEQCCNFW
ncbi:cysteine-rich and transmembrane domain-containing protein WIH2-like [Amaranthus tricolor]|uniref:cysteine-rich and transmembrane domain-containing protein WIH2-like n=1 Tax=Amaranthus tricolor TaxID=29722 RepID=UPI0025833C36|nr:cysteine-rich and transmembrane domain-containing protein WIH2-like [Amaranthus tricolor]